MQQHEGSDEARCVVACPHKTELALNIFELAIVDKVFVQRFFLTWAKASTESAKQIESFLKWQLSAENERTLEAARQ